MNLGDFYEFTATFGRFFRAIGLNWLFKLVFV